MDCDIVVIGAGLAGLRCARTLQEARYAVTLLEAADSVGGRVWTERVDGFTVDRGFQVLNPAYPAVRRWVDVAALDLHAFDAGLLVRTRDGLRTVADPIRAPQHALATVRSGLLSARDLAGLTWWLGPALADPQRSVAQGDSPLTQALDRAHVTGPLRRILDRFIAGVVVDSHGTTSANFTRLLLRMFALGRPGLPAGGMTALPEQLARGLADIRLGAPARGIASPGTRHTVDTDDGPVACRAVVVATDTDTAARLTGIPARATKGLVTWWYAAGEAPSPYRLLAVDGRGGHAPPGPVWNTAVVSNAAPSYAPPGRHLVQATTLLDRPDGDAPDAEVSRHLADIYGCDTTAWEMVARHRIPKALPASPPPLRLTSGVEVGDGVFVCGDHRDTASIQGALVSGQRAADAVVRFLRGA
ncbi:MAG: protoporphyrinogen/coproporphyrinogen oxidase [Dermatophilaceae bacterium]